MKRTEFLLAHCNARGGDLLSELLESVLIYWKTSNITALNKFINSTNIYTHLLASEEGLLHGIMELNTYRKMHPTAHTAVMTQSYISHCSNDTHPISHTAVMTRILQPTLQ